MKTINVTFDDKEYKELIKIKGETSWHDFIIQKSTEQKEVDENGSMGNRKLDDSK